MKAVIYLFKNHKKINGTLFYCFEYFLCARKTYTDLKYIIYGISSVDLELVKDIFKEKYLFDFDELNNVIGINSIKDLYDQKIIKCLILDLHTFNKVYSLISADIICYSNEHHQMIRSDNKKISYYGFYDYQPRDHEIHLKLNFNVFRPLNGQDRNALMVSSRLYNYNEISIPDEISHLKVLTKNESSHYQNVHERFDTLFYFHSALDTNNRLIPECFFYNKKIVIEFNNTYNDSVYLRYADILENGLSKYALDSSDLMLQDFLN